MDRISGLSLLATALFWVSLRPCEAGGQSFRLTENAQGAVEALEQGLRSDTAEETAASARRAEHLMVGSAGSFGDPGSVVGVRSSYRPSSDGYVMNAAIATRDVTPTGPASPSISGPVGSGRPMRMTPYNGNWISMLLAIGLSLAIVAGFPLIAVLEITSPGIRRGAKAVGLDLPKEVVGLSDTALKSAAKMIAWAARMDPYTGRPKARTPAERIKNRAPA